MQHTPLDRNARTVLQHELQRRCQKNTRYSLRAFARALGMSHTVLSLVMSGKRDLSKKAAQKIVERLELSKSDRDIFLKRRSGWMTPDESFEFIQLSLDQFELLSDWHHYAILSLLEIPNAQFSAAWVAKRLGISRIQAKLAMERLLRMKLVEKKDGRWRQSGMPLKVENTVSTAATRKFHRQLLEKALDSLENDAMELRDFSSITLAMDPAQIPYARERIRQFRRQLMKELEAKGSPKEVYNLTVQIYPVSKEKK